MARSFSPSLSHSRHGVFVGCCLNVHFLDFMSWKRQLLAHGAASKDQGNSAISSGDVWFAFHTLSKLQLVVTHGLSAIKEVGEGSGEGSLVTACCSS